MKEKEPRPHLLCLMRSSPESRENAVCPIIGRDVKSTKHLWGSDGLGVHAHLLVRLPALCHCLHEHVDTLGLSGAARTERHHAVSDGLCLVQLDQLEDPRRVEDEAKLCHLVGGEDVTHRQLGRAWYNDIQSSNNFKLRYECQVSRYIQVA